LGLLKNNNNWMAEFYNDVFACMIYTSKLHQESNKTIIW